MRYQLDIRGDEFLDYVFEGPDDIAGLMNFASRIEKLRNVGYKFAEQILLPEFLSRNKVPEDIAEDVWIHMGYINREGINSASSYEQIEKIERDYNLGRGKLIGLLDVALGKYP